jgi:8-hydroxy-5-deazaflavin:NADPH oxidoreductase
MSEHRIAIIGGTGDQGKGLALRWACAGYSLIIGSRDRERAEKAAEEMSPIVRSHTTQDLNPNFEPNFEIKGATNAEAAGAASIVVLTVPFAAQIPILKEIHGSLQPGSLLVDVTVPVEAAVGGKPSRVLGVWSGSAAQQCAEIAPETVQVVSAFHNVAAAALADLNTNVECDIIVCGDDKSAKQRLIPLVEAIPGCRYVDGGALANSRTVEAMTALLIGINIRYKTHSGVRITGIT